jgi:hypothetical protein
MERDEDGVVLGSTRLPGSQRLHRKGDATREAGCLVGPMTAADPPSAISVFRFIGDLRGVTSSEMMHSLIQWWADLSPGWRYVFGLFFLLGSAGVWFFSGRIWSAGFGIGGALLIAAGFNFNP